jgi:uroporphyrin-III C-methyltransferase/precorrin-2 dehydrogenase/sirohydrochlorin ferrochelatase
LKTLPVTLNNPKTLLIGGGKVAKQKAEVLIKNDIDFKVISKDFIEDFPLQNIDFQRRIIFLDDLKDFSFVIDATGKNEVGELVKEGKERFKYLLNRVDKPLECDLFFNSLVLRGDLKIAVSTSGKSPKMGQIIRDRIDRETPVDFKELLTDFGEKRKKGVIDIEKIEKETKQRLKKVYLIGAGTGDPELLTVKAYRLLQNLDVVFYDHLISKEILELVPESCKLVSVGKQKGSHSKKQSEINKLMVDEVENGSLVGRLKAGDPYIFGRGGEEFLFLNELGISVEVVAGVSSSTSFGLPPTVRGYSSGFTVVSAHLSGNRVNLDWIDLLKIENHTVIVLMGLSRVKEIFERAIELDIRENLPTLFISNISRSNEKRVSGDLKDMVSLSKRVDKPAIIVFGNVVRLDKIINRGFENE